MPVPLSNSRLPLPEKRSQPLVALALAKCTGIRLAGADELNGCARIRHSDAARPGDRLFSARHRQTLGLREPLGGLIIGFLSVARVGPRKLLRHWYAKCNRHAAEWDEWEHGRAPSGRAGAGLCLNAILRPCAIRCASRSAL